MVKRARSQEATPTENPPKRVKSSTIDRFSRLSDELILRVLSFLDVSQLTACQRLSHRYQSLAGDGQLWKAHYYNRFVRPRASRLPALKDAGMSQDLHFASKASRWLEDEHLVGQEAKTNWKRQYKLRHNWSRGSCAVNEVQVAENAPVPPILVQMHGGVIYMADQMDGLRAWSAKGERKMLARLTFEPPRPPPTSIAIDACGQNDIGSRILVGFEDGCFSMFAYRPDESSLFHQYTHPPSTNGVLSASSLSWPYAATMTATQRLSLYRFTDVSVDAVEKPLLDSPRLLYSLKSHTVWPPLTTSLRTTNSDIVISIAYALPTYLSGWTVGIQEVKLSPTGDFVESRIASAIDQHYRPLAFSSAPISPYLMPPAIGGLVTSTTLELRHIHSKPTSLSYTHPYLLVSHPDNTLALYLVTSTAAALSISAGSRLWGHTSSVSGAEVGSRGKAVSVSRRGDELRVWELEGGFASSAARKRLTTGELSVRLRPESKNQEGASDAQAGLDLVSNARVTSGTPAETSELTLTRGWIGFDEENVVVLKEQSHGKLALVIYDFT